MSYSDPKFYARTPDVVLSAASFGTATASSVTGANTTPSVYLPQFMRRTQVNKVQFVVTTIPNAASTALVCQVLNGTNTAATVTLTTATLGQVLTGTMSAANAIFAANTGPTVTVTGTATASAAAQGSYTVIFETQELYA